MRQTRRLLLSMPSLHIATRPGIVIHPKFRLRDLHIACVLQTRASTGRTRKGFPGRELTDFYWRR
jgi:hypothetical protein